MVTVENVLKTLEGVQDPELGGNVVELGMISDVSVDGSAVEVGLALTVAECPLRNQIEGDTLRRVQSMPVVDEVIVRTTAMTKGQRAGLMSVARRKAQENAEPTHAAGGLDSSRHPGGHGRRQWRAGGNHRFSGRAGSDIEAHGVSSAADSVVQLVPPADLETCTGRIAKCFSPTWTPGRLSRVRPRYCLGGIQRSTAKPFFSKPVTT